VCWRSGRGLSLSQELDFEEGGGGGELGGQGAVGDRLFEDELGHDEAGFGDWLAKNRGRGGIPSGTPSEVPALARGFPEVVPPLS